MERCQEIVRSRVNGVRRVKGRAERGKWIDLNPKRGEYSRKVKFTRYKASLTLLLPWLENTRIVTADFATI